MMKITGLSHLFKWENLHNWWLTKYFFAPLYIALGIPKANTSFGRLSFLFSAANDWNELQKSLKLESYISLSNFMHQLSKQLTVPVPDCT